MSEYAAKIGDALERGGMLQDVRPNSGFYPSAASVKIPDDVFGESTVGGCLRQIWYSWKRFPKNRDDNAGSMMRLYLGNWAHDGFEKLLAQIQMTTGLIVVSSEHSFWKPIWRESGRSDILCWDQHKKRYVILEVKTVNSEWGPSGYKKAIEQPKLEYVLQSLVYKHTYKELDPLVHIIYVNLMANKRVPAIFGHEVISGNNLTDHVAVIGPNGRKEYRQITMQKVVDRWKELEGYLRSNTLPPPDYRQNYSEDEAVGIYEAGRFAYKAESKAVADWLKAGAEPGKLELPYAPGDPQCSWCPYSEFCTANTAEHAAEDPTSQELDRFVNLPKVLGNERDSSDGTTSLL